MPERGGELRLARWILVGAFGGFEDYADHAGGLDLVPALDRVVVRDVDHIETLRHVAFPCVASLHSAAADHIPCSLLWGG